MDEILDCFFDQVFSEMERDSLLAKYKRRQLVEYLSTVIQGCTRVEGDSNAACRKCVVSALDFHDATKGKNGQICLMGKYHNVLYVAAKLAFDWNLQDSEVVARLLEALYLCERAFDRLMSGAIFGPKASGVISGWKSDFDTIEENVNAVGYFLEHACREKAEYKTKNGRVRLVDVPMETYGRTTPATVAVQVTRPDFLLLLLQHGAQVFIENSPSPLEVLLKRLSDSPDRIPSGLRQCLFVIMRVVTFLPWRGEEEFLEPYFPGLKFIPETRMASPPELKHFCRIAIRTRLHENFQLPIGIWSLPVPESLQHYINIEED
ncbi:uncharacterized protein LOC106664962 [Cimex lectularius]|uniref:SOCS box domain-containing protein n=1 Tax=Cimex lectularius TaxID=79782 RepID=A0A8I6RMV4_CIMLE|nr:uncharacterized protein LOC106664962 [Cimex lectularius]